MNNQYPKENELPGTSGAKASAAPASAAPASAAPASAAETSEAEGFAPNQLSQLSYEEARAELAQIVQKMESGQIGLEESIALWERAEALATHCQSWLEGARKRLDKVVAKEHEG